MKCFYEKNCTIVAYYCIKPSAFIYTYFIDYKQYESYN